MSSHPLWMPPPPTSIATGIAQAHADRPDMVTLTIGLKLRTSWFKEEVLKTTRQRITGMKFEVLEIFRRDLEQISRRKADQHLIEAIVAAIAGQAGNDPQKQIAIAGLRKALDHLRSNSSGVALATAVIDTTAATADDAVDGLGLLRQYLEQWHIDHPDQLLDNT